MSTPNERLEATVWLESHSPDASSAVHAEFFAAVDDYYEANPIAGRGTDIMTILREDNSVFAETLAAVQHDAESTRVRSFTPVIRAPRQN